MGERLDTAVGEDLERSHKRVLGGIVVRFRSGGVDMTSPTAEVRAFFDEFERNSAELAIDRIAAQFADTFMNADPQGVMPVPKAAFIATLPQREKMFQAAGIRRIRLAAVRETVLDPMYILASTDWIAESIDGAEIPLASSFILRRQASSFVVVFYLNHQDIAAVLAARAPKADTG